MGTWTMPKIILYPIHGKRWNKPPLTPIQRQERKRRRMLMWRMMFGMPTPLGTKPRQYPTGEPVFKPMPRQFPDPLGFIMGFISLMPWMGRRRREAEIAGERRSQSLKAMNKKQYHEY